MFLNPWRIHGADIYIYMLTSFHGLCWWDPWHTIYSSTMLMGCHGMNPPRVIIQYWNGTPQLNSRLRFINPGLTLLRSVISWMYPLKMLLIFHSFLMFFVGWPGRVPRLLKSPWQQHLCWIFPWWNSAGNSATSTGWMRSPCQANKPGAVFFKTYSGLAPRLGDLGNQEMDEIFHGIKIHGKNHQESLWCRKISHLR